MTAPTFDVETLPEDRDNWLHATAWAIQDGLDVPAWAASLVFAESSGESRRPCQLCPDESGLIVGSFSVCENCLLSLYKDVPWAALGRIVPEEMR